MPMKLAEFLDALEQTPREGWDVIQGGIRRTFFEGYETCGDCPIEAVLRGMGWNPYWMTHEAVDLLGDLHTPIVRSADDENEDPYFDPALRAEILRRVGLPAEKETT